MTSPPLTEYWIEFACSVRADSPEQLDEIVARLTAALQSTEWKVDVDVTTIEEA